MIRWHYRILFILLALYSFIFYPEASNKGKNQKNKYNIIWLTIDEGLSYGQIAMNSKVEVADKNIYILKINPEFYKFELLCSTESDTVFRTAADWCKLKGCVAGFNAGMFSLKDYKKGMGYVRNYDHFNNNEFRTVYKAIAAFNRKDNSVPDFQIIDLEKEAWGTIEPKYNSFLQSIRMIDANRKLSSWKRKKKLSCSMIVIATDVKRNVLILITRIPYPLDVFSQMMLEMPLDIQRAMYLEGGPQASLYVETKDSTIQKYGSWVYPGYAHDKNDHLWELPNIIGVKKRK